MPPYQPLLSEQAAFAQHLFIQGYPLWTPSPDLLPPDRRNEGLRIADVGIVDEQGRFDYFSNILESIPGSVDSPLDFPSIEINDVRCEGGDLLAREVLSSPATSWQVDQLDIPIFSNNPRTAAQYSSTLSDDGAHIILPRGAQLFELGASHQRLLENLARRHGADWLVRFSDRLEASRCTSLYILTGFYKTSAWSIASFSMQRAANTDPVHVRCTLVEEAERTIREDSVWQPAGRFGRKIGPAPNRQGHNNQSIFIRGITVTPNISKEAERGRQAVGSFGRLFSANWFLNPPAGDPPNSTPTGDAKCNVIIKRVPQTLQASHPSEIINQYLLAKEPSAKIAVSHDNQWITMLRLAEGGNSWTLEDLEDQLGELVPRYYSIVKENDVVYLREKEEQSGMPDDLVQISDPCIPSDDVRVIGSSTASHHTSPSHHRDQDPVQMRAEEFTTKGDKAMRSNNPEEAVMQYSAALSLNLSNPANLLVKRSIARAMLGLWDVALSDADDAIKVDPSSPWGYERRHAALHCLQRYDESIAAFTRMFSLIEESFDPDTRRLGKEYVSPARSETTIDNVVCEAFRLHPLVLIDVKSGRLCGRAERLLIFKSESQFKALVSSMTRELDDRRILQVVEKYFEYVTFSHVWQGKEPSFQDVQSVNSVWYLDSSPLNEKLRKFCEMVHSHGYRWAWSDTCCIDKTDSMVLNQSIKMMYKWYEESAATLVLLASVESPSAFGDLARSVWMTRAWTVQELLVSKVIRFYDCNWNPYLGDTRTNHKESPQIMQELATAIGVAQETIVTFNPSNLTVRQKLGLASTRHATLEEDVAYSLIGIFKSNIQPHYGEGAAALGRLLEDVMARSGDVTVLAWAGRSSSYNSCLPATISVYAQIPSAAHVEKTQGITVLRTSLPETETISIQTQIIQLPPVRFTNRRLYLPCIAFTVTKFRVQSLGQEVGYCAQVSGLGRVEFKTSDVLWPTESCKLVFIYPWIHDLGDPPEDFSRRRVWDGSEPESIPGPETGSMTPTLAVPTSPTTGVDDYTRALRLVVRLQKPFHALLLQQQSNGEFKRVAADHTIIVPGLQSQVNISRGIHARVVEIL